MKFFVVFTIRTANGDVRRNDQLTWSGPPRDIDAIRAMEAHISGLLAVDPAAITIERVEPFAGQTNSEVEL